MKNTICPICYGKKYWEAQTCRTCYIKYRHVRTSRERFWEKVDIKGIKDCWNWKAAVGNKYGAFTFHRKQYHSHRVAWIFKHGEIPEGKIICHHCDNYLCVNPNHLFIGTHQDNLDDMVRKNRHNFQGNARVNPDIVRAMRKKYNEGNISTPALGELFNISKAQAWRIVAKKAWKNVRA